MRYAAAQHVVAELRSVSVNHQPLGGASWGCVNSFARIYYMRHGVASTQLVRRYGASISCVNPGRTCLAVRQLVAAARHTSKRLGSSQVVGIKVFGGRCWRGRVTSYMDEGAKCPQQVFALPNCPTCVRGYRSKGTGPWGPAFLFHAICLINMSIWGVGWAKTGFMNKNIN